MRVRGFVILGVLLFVMVGCCDYIVSEANELKRDQKKCQAGDTCIIYGFYESIGDGNCLEEFQCSSSLNEKNISDFTREAKSLVKRYEHCNECVSGQCAPIDMMEPFCNEETGMCEWSETGQ